MANLTTESTVLATAASRGSLLSDEITKYMTMIATIGLTSK